MILVLGADGYMGSAFQAALRERGWDYRPLSRREVDYTRFNVLLKLLRESQPAFVISAAGFTGKPNVDACELAKADTLAGNVNYLLTLAQACHAAGIPYGHISSGCIYSGAKVVAGGQIRVEKDLTTPAMRALLASDPGAFRGFTEEDEPNFSFRQGPCSFYSGTKALGEEAVRSLGGGFLWRLRIPFDEVSLPKNYLTKILSYAKVYDNVNSISHRGDFARACLDLWQLRAPFGVYNIVNPGHVSTRQVVGLIEQHLKPAKTFQFWENDEEFYRVAAKTPRSNCILDASKLLNAGVKIRPVEEALVASLKNWVQG